MTNVPAADYADLAVTSGREVSGLEAAQVGRVLGRYEQVKRDRGVIDFDDILLCASALLTEFDDIAEEVRATYRHLVVDEYQDVNPVQQTLLDLWWESAPTIAWWAIRRDDPLRRGESDLSDHVRCAFSGRSAGAPGA